LILHLLSWPTQIDDWLILFPGKLQPMDCGSPKFLIKLQELHSRKIHFQDFRPMPPSASMLTCRRRWRRPYRWCWLNRTVSGVFFLTGRWKISYKEKRPANGLWSGFSN